MRAPPNPLACSRKERGLSRPRSFHFNPCRSRHPPPYAASSTLAAGHYTGTVQLHVCSDTSCTTQVGGSPLVVPYDIQVAAKPANSGLTALSVQPGVPAWEMFQGNAAHTGYVPVTIDPTKFATRWLWSAPGPPSTVAVEGTGQGTTCS